MIYALVDCKEEGNLYIKLNITYLIDEFLVHSKIACLFFLYAHFCNVKIFLPGNVYEIKNNRWCCIIRRNMK